MAKGTKIIKSRLKSIKNTKKITKAMELVSASKMKKTVDKVLSARPYSSLAWETVSRLIDKVEKKDHPLLNLRKKIDNIAIIVISSNRGLCGGFNSQIIAKTLKFIQALKNDYPNACFKIITLGKKGGEAIIRAGLPLFSDYKKEDVVLSVEEILPLAKIVVADYLNKKFDRVFIIYTDFVSSLKQETKIKQILPFAHLHEDKMLGKVDTKNIETSEEKNNKVVDYIFEPNAQQVLDLILPRLVELQLFQAILESNASEHSARMLAMKNASDAALDMIGELTLTFNKARQAGITQEIAEISAGKAVLEQ